jgi:hypothetical protein
MGQVVTAAEGEVIAFETKKAVTVAQAGLHLCRAFDWIPAPLPHLPSTLFVQQKDSSILAKSQAVQQSWNCFQQLVKRQVLPQLLPQSLGSEWKEALMGYFYKGDSLRFLAELQAVNATRASFLSGMVQSNCSPNPKTCPGSPFPVAAFADVTLSNPQRSYIEQGWKWVSNKMASLLLQ